jgi:hypothetical protein
MCKELSERVSSEVKRLLGTRKLGTIAMGAHPKTRIGVENPLKISHRQTSPNYVEMAIPHSPKSSRILVSGQSYFRTGTRSRKETVAGRITKRKPDVCALSHTTHHKQLRAFKVL